MISHYLASKQWCIFNQLTFNRLIQTSKSWFFFGINLFISIYKNYEKENIQGNL